MSTDYSALLLEYPAVISKDQLLADMANPIKLILRDNIGNLVPVDGCVVHSNTPFKVYLPV